MKCPACQFENPGDAQFCISCGRSMEFRCPGCGAITPASGKFCKACGYEIRSTQEPPPLDLSKPQSYTPKYLADKILTSRSSVEGERKLVTVFFADVADFTSMSERLDPEEVHQIMDGCFRILMDEIHKYEGTINQFTGDGVMALFGAPVAHEDHALRGCYAALSIQNAMGEYGNKIEKDTGVKFKMRIGLNSGPVIVGSIGDDLRMDYTAVGDTTNLASRMESLAGPGSILVSENTQRLVKDFFELKPLGPVEVKGKEALQAVYELEKTGKAITRFDASVAKGLTRFVGRKNSMAALWEAWENAASGSGQVVGLVGEAGVGKSRLLLEFRNRLSPSEVTYLEGGCLHFGGSMPYLPFLDILKTFFNIEEEDREFIVKKKITDKITGLDEELTHILTPAQSLLSLKVDDEAWNHLKPQDRREKTFEALRDLFIRLSQNRPLVLAVEDLHWIDRTSEEFLGYLIGWLATTPILLILLYRPEYTHQWGSKSYYYQIRVDQLTLQSSSELVSAILEGGDVVPELRDLILTRAAGNPLYMEELARSMLENGSIEKRDNLYALSGIGATLEVPDSIQGIIAARLDRLEENLKRTMQVASVIGRDFAFRILQRVTDMREDLKKSLLSLQGLEFIYEKQIFPELEYIFKHAMIQEVAYDSLLVMRRKELHQRIGQAIEEIYPDRLEELCEMLAYHYSTGGNLEKAYQYLKLSGEKAVRNYSNQEALVFYKQAVQAIEKQPESEENKRKIIEVIRQMTIPMYYLSYPEDSLQILEQGESLAIELGDEKAQAIFNSRMATLFTFKGEYKLALEYGEKSYRQAEKIEDLDLMVQTSSSILTVYFSRGQAHRTIELASRVIFLMEETQRHKDFFGPYAFCCAYSGLASGYLGNFEEGQLYFEKGLGAAGEIEHLITLGTTEMFRGMFWGLKGDGKKAIEHCQKSIRYFEEAEFPFILGIAWTGSGWGYYLLGDLDTARHHCQKGLEIQAQSGSVFFLALPYMISALVEYDSRDLEKARGFAEKARTLSQDHGEKHIEVLSSYILGATLTRINPEQINLAEELILKGIEIVRELDLKPFIAFGYFYMGECFVNAGQNDKALEHLNTAEKMFQELGGNEFYSNRGMVIRDRLEN